MAGLTADEKATSRIRSLGGLICPRCRHHEAELPASAKVSRCPNDGFALIEADILAAADGDPFLGVTVAERFVILGKLGAGSMGTVYRARQEPMGRDVAIKILRSDRAFDIQAKARFTREARAMSLLTSPHTVTVFDFGEIPDQGDELSSGSASLYLAMEMLSGEALGERLKRVRRLPVEEATRIARHALYSLAEAHDKGIVHRDLKPDNLFLTLAADGQEICKVLDFGIAKLTAEHGVDALETQAGTVFGTPRYMSPEQAQGKALDARSDLYSLGVLLYQMLVGRPPFIDEDAVVVMARHIKTTPAAPAVAARDVGIGEELSRVVMRALAKDPGDRPASARQFIDDLDRALEQQAQPLLPGGVPVGAAREGSSGETPALVQEGLEDALSLNGRRARRRARALWISVGALGAAVLAGLFTMGRMRGPPRPPLAQKELTEQVQKRRLPAIDVVAGSAVSSAPPAPLLASAEPPASSAASSASAPASSVKKPGGGKRPYKRFD